MPVHLGQLPIGSSAIIKQINDTSSYANKLLLLGLTPGAHIKVIRCAPMGDPIQIQVRGYSLSLRKDEVSIVTVEPV